MKILFLSTGNPFDKMNSSGTVYHIYKLLSQNNDVIFFETCHVSFVQIIIKKIYSFFGFCYFPDRIISFQKRLSKKIQSVIIKEKIEYVFATGSVPLSFVSLSVPCSFYTDSCFGIMAKYYWSNLKFTKRQYRQAYEIETRSIKNATHIFYVTEWAAKNACLYHNCDKSKVSVIYRGGNNVNKKSFGLTQAFILSRSIITKSGPIEFLFVGKEWIRKGGEFINKVLNILLLKKYDIILHIVGCKPIIKGELCSHTIFDGIIDANNEVDCQRLSQLFQESSFYFQPSMKECMGIAFVEASSYGLPCIAKDTGGVSEIVNCENGILLTNNDTPLTCANKIDDILSDKKSYLRKCFLGYSRYIKELNWEVVGNKIIDEINIEKKSFKKGGIQ